MMDRLRLTAVARNQLIALKKRTGIEHYNVLCRHALCISLANSSISAAETHNLSTGVEIDWRTFTGGQEVLYLNLIAARLVSEGARVTPEAIRQAVVDHVHRGLGYLVGRREEDLLLELASSVAAAA